MLKLSLSNGKPILIGAAHIQALITSGTGDGSTVILGGGVSYEVSQQPEMISRMIEALNAGESPEAVAKMAVAATSAIQPARATAPKPEAAMPEEPKPEAPKKPGPRTTASTRPVIKPL